MPAHLTLDADLAEPRSTAPAAVAPPGPPTAPLPTAPLPESEGLSRWLRQHCESAQLIVSAVVVSAAAMPQAGADLAQAAVARWPQEDTSAGALLMAARAAMQRERPVDIALTLATAGDHCNRVIALPLRQGSLLLGGVALGLSQADSGLAQAQLAALELACQRLVTALAQPSEAPRQHAAQQALSLQAAFLAQPVLAQAGAVLCAELAAALHCDRVVLGLNESDEMQVLAVSHGPRPQPGHELTRLLGSALQEAADQGARVLYPAAVDEPLRVVLAHAELHARSAMALATVPLVHQGGVVGALMIEKRGDAVFGTPALGLLEAVGGALAPVLHMRQQAARPWRSRLNVALTAGLARLRQRDDPLPKLLLGLGLAVVLSATLVPLPYRVTAPARLEGAVQRVIVAPMDGYLHKTHVRPGDSVAEGDLLIEMADQDLMLEQRKWESALVQHENSYAAALARADRAQFIIAQGKAAEAKAQLELVRRQLGRSQLVAPISGIVIKGDLSQALGAPVQRGETLVTLAPARDFRLMVEVDERDIGRIAPGRQGEVALSALPAQPLAFEIERITPVATVTEGRNAFEVQARMLQPPPNLRPGLQGVAKIDAGERSLLWLLAHRAFDTLRGALWAWGW